MINKLLTLESNSKILHTHKEDLFDNHIFLSIKFNLGSYFDPIYKEGLTHLLEHLLISKDLVAKAKQFGCKINALTDYNYISFSISGPYGELVNDYGVKPIYDDFIRQIIELNIDEEKLAKEIQIVSTEIEREGANKEMEFHYKALCEIFDNKNPLRKNNLGTKKSIDNISINDLTEHHRKMLKESSILFEIYTVGSEHKFEKVLKQIQRTSESFNSLSSLSFPYEMIDHLNKSQKDYQIRSTTHEGIIKNCIVSEVNIPSVDFRNELLKEMVNNYVSPMIWSEVRKQGLAYLSKTYLFELFNKQLIISILETNSNNSEYKIEFTDIVRKILNHQMLELILDKAIENILKKDKLIPIKPLDIFETNRKSIFERGLIVDIGKNRERLLKNIDKEEFITQFSNSFNFIEYKY